MTSRRTKALSVGLAWLLVVLGIAVVQTPSASATPVCGGGPVVGQTVAVQKPAYEYLWAPTKGGYNAFCGEGMVGYSVATERQALESWWFVKGESFVVPGLRPFLALDMAPNIGLINNAAAAVHSKILTIPVAQTALGIVVNPPTGCAIDEITNKQLEGVMRGTIKVWNKIQTAAGEGCTNAPITRVARAEGAASTYQLKNYLSKVSEASLTCLPTNTKVPTWKGMAPINYGFLTPQEEPNTVWPENSGASGCTTEVSALARAGGEGELVRKVNKTEGSVGYATLPYIETYKGFAGENPNGDTHWIKLQNNGVSNKLSTAEFAGPLEPSVNAANCFEAQYPVPTAAQVGAANPANADWSQVFGFNTSAGLVAPGSYPLCMMVYVEALAEYQNAGFSLERMWTTKDFIASYLLGAEGQEQLEYGGKWYAPVPSAGTAPYNALGAAQYAAGKMAY
jgi:ABC-type phosphate transport system substrate-binding protein